MEHLASVFIYLFLIEFTLMIFFLWYFLKIKIENILMYSFINSIIKIIFAFILLLLIDDILYSLGFGFAIVYLEFTTVWLTLKIIFCGIFNFFLNYISIYLFLAKDWQKSYEVSLYENCTFLTITLSWIFLNEVTSYQKGSL